MELVFMIPLAGVAAVLYAAYLAWDVLRRDQGTPEMQDVASMIFEGAMAFLRRQYGTIAALYCNWRDRGGRLGGGEGHSRLRRRR